MSSIRSMDHLPPLTAARLAWMEPGSDPAHHERMKKELRKSMPLLAHSLDRAAKHADESYKARGRYF